MCTSSVHHVASPRSLTRVATMKPYGPARIAETLWLHVRFAAIESLNSLLLSQSRLRSTSMMTPNHGSWAGGNVQAASTEATPPACRSGTQLSPPPQTPTATDAAPLMAVATLVCPASTVARPPQPALRSSVAQQQKLQTQLLPLPRVVGLEAEGTVRG